MVEKDRHAIQQCQNKSKEAPDFVCSRSLRYAAYRQFCWFAHAWLGSGVRRVIPSRVVNKTRAEYPSDDGQYVGFKERIESS